MVTLCWAAKGGSGTTVVVSTLALDAGRPALLADLSGDVPLVLGLPAPDRPGVADWLHGDGPATQLVDLVSDVDDTTALLPYRLDAQRPLGEAAQARWDALVEWFGEWEARHDGDVFIDAGTGSPPDALADLVANRWLVTRACYLSLTRAAAGPVRPTGTVLVAEAGRSLGRADVERAIGAPVVATVSYDPKVARAVDAGLMLSRPPLVIRRELRRAAA